MASNTGAAHGHLDATAGRTVVFCHACHNEWYEDEQGAELCSRCGGDIIELVSPESDPRELYYEDSSTGSPPEVPPHPYADDSDPEEGDIEEHVHYPGGFRMNQRMWDSRSPGQGPGTSPFDHFPGVGGGRDAPPEEGEAVFRRFVDMISGFGMNRPGPGSPAPGSPAQGSPAPRSPMPERDPFNPVFGDNIRRRTFTGPNGMHTSVTITSGPIHFGAPRTGPDEFPQAFRTILGGMGPPRTPQQGEGEQGHPGGQGGPRDPANDLLQSLQELLSVMVDPANARHGDAVYSQEALDRIISNLMEANPQSNAAPPASEDAMAKLERRKMDEAMQAKEGGKVECTVCIDEIKVGDEVLFLPCKHWFHEACVTMWLKEHNTCPICRTPIEAGGGNGNGNRNARASGQQGQGQGPGAGPSGQQGTGPGPGPPPFRGRAFGVPIFFTAGRPEPGDAQARNSGTSGDRVNRWPNVGSRRSSMSPPPPPGASDAGSRARERSPSTNSRRSTPAEPEQREGSRPLRWLQDRFGGRSERRQP